MSFKVSWRKAARDKLAALYLAATDKRAVTQAAHLAERELQRDPIGRGIQARGNRRSMAQRPLVILYDVFLDDKKVLVVDIKSFSPEM